MKRYSYFVYIICLLLSLPEYVLAEQELTCIGDNFTQGEPVQNATPPIINLTAPSSAYVGETLALTAAASVDSGAGGSAFYYWCVEKGRLQADPAYPDYRQVKYILPALSGGTVEVGVRVGDGLGHVKSDKATISISYAPTVSCTPTLVYDDWEKILPSATVTGGQYITQQWRLRNQTNCDAYGYRLAVYPSDATRNSIPYTYSNSHYSDITQDTFFISDYETGNVTATFRSPQDTGTYRIYFNILKPTGAALSPLTGGRLWAELNVVQDTSADSGTVRAIITPASAVAAGARWRVVDYGNWQSSGASLSGFRTGYYQIQFKSISDWDVPASRRVRIVSGDVKQLSANYIQAAASTEPSGELDVTYNQENGRFYLNYQVNSNTSYMRVFYSVNGSTNWTRVFHRTLSSQSSGTGNQPVEISGAENDTRLHFKLEAQNKDTSESFETDVVSVTYTPKPLYVEKGTEAPGVPNLYNLGSSTWNDWVEVRWSKVLDSEHNDNVVYYELKYADNVSFNNATTQNIGNPAINKRIYESLGYTVNNLQDDKTYYFRIRGVNNAGIGPWSLSRNIDIAIQDLPTFDENYQEPQDGATNISKLPTLRWSASDPDEDDLDYYVTIGTSQDNLYNRRSFKSNYEGQDWFSHADEWHEQLSPNTTYYWQIWVREHGRYKDYYGEYIKSPIWSFTTLAQGPDLLITSAQPVETVQPDTTVTFNVTVENQGNETADRRCFDADYIKQDSDTPFRWTSGCMSDDLAAGGQEIVPVEVRFERAPETHNNKYYDNVLVAGATRIRFRFDRTDDQDLDDTNDNKLVDVTYQDAGGPDFTFFRVTEYGVTGDQTTANFWARMGETLEMTFIVEDDVRTDAVEFQYRLHGTDAWTTIESLTHNYPSFNKMLEWPVPENIAETHDAQVRLVARDDQNNESSRESDPFSIYTNNLNAVIAPSANSYTVGDTMEYTIAASGDYPVDLLDINLDCGAIWESVYEENNPQGITLANPYQWAIPDKNNLASSNCLLELRIRDDKGVEKEFASANFELLPNTAVGGVFGDAKVVYQNEFVFPADALYTEQWKNVEFVEIDENNLAHIVLGHHYGYYRDVYGPGNYSDDREDVYVNVNNKYYITYDKATDTVSAPILIAGNDYNVVDFKVLGITPYVLLEDAMGFKQPYYSYKNGSAFSTPVIFENSTIPAIQSMSEAIDTEPDYSHALSSPYRHIYLNGYLWELDIESNGPMSRFSFSQGQIGVEDRFQISSFGTRVESYWIRPVADGSVIYFVDPDESKLVKLNTSTLSATGYSLPYAISDQTIARKTVLAANNGQVFIFGNGKVYTLQSSSVVEVADIRYTFSEMQVNYASLSYGYAKALVTTEGKIYLILGSDMRDASPDIYPPIEILEFNPNSFAFTKRVADLPESPVGHSGYELTYLGNNKAIFAYPSGNSMSTLNSYDATLRMLDLETGAVLTVGKLHTLKTNDPISLEHINGTLYALASSLSLLEGINNNHVSSYQISLSNHLSEPNQIGRPHFVSNGNDLYAVWRYGHPFDGTWNTAEDRLNNYVLRKNHAIKIAPSTGAVTQVYSAYLGYELNLNENYLSATTYGDVYTVNSDLSVTQPFFESEISSNSLDFTAYGATYKAGFAKSLGSYQYDLTAVKADATTSTLVLTGQGLDVATFDNDLVWAGYKSSKYTVGKYDIAKNLSTTMEVGSSVSGNDAYKRTAINSNQHVALGWGNFIAVGDFSTVTVAQPSISLNNTETQAVHGTSVVLDWTVAADSAEITRYEIYKEVDNTNTLLATLAATAATYPYVVTDTSSAITLKVVAYDQSDQTDFASLNLEVVADGQNAVSFVQNAYQFNEEDGTVALTVSRLGSSTGSISVNYSIVPGSALSGSDYTDVSGILTWLDGDTASQAIAVELLDDGDYEGEQSFTVTLSDPQWATLNTPESAAVTINDDVDLNHGSLEFTGTPYNVSEDGGSITLTIARTGGSDGLVSVNYGTVNGSATAGSHYKGSSGMLEWADGEATARQLSVSLLNDATYDGDKTFTLLLFKQAGGVEIGASNPVTVTIIDDEPAPSPGVLEFTSATQAVAETDGTIQITVTRLGGSDGAASVDYSVGGGTASAGDDYTGTTTDTLHWADGDSTSKTISFSLVNDMDYECEETLSLSLANFQEASAGAVIATTLTIQDDECIQACNTPNLSIPDYSPQGAADMISVSNGNEITDLDVFVDISHTWVGDLVLTLKHVDTGTVVTLMNRPGSMGCSGDDAGITLDDDATVNVQDNCSSDPQPAYSEEFYIPYESLSQFATETFAGTWELTASDNSMNDTGKLNEWCLLPVVEIPNNPPVAMDVNVTGAAQVGETLSGAYSYQDDENDPKGTSAFQWYRADDAVAANKTAIAGATAETYTLFAADKGKNIGFGVTPVALSGTSPGVESLSVWSGPVTQPIAPPFSTIESGYACIQGDGRNQAFSWLVIENAGNTVVANNENAVTPLDSANQVAFSLAMDMFTNGVSVSPSGNCIGLGNHTLFLGEAGVSDYTQMCQVATANSCTFNPTMELLTEAEMLGSIRGIVWDDVNGNGLQDSSEAYRQNWMVILTHPDSSQTSTNTNANGAYEFTDLANGDYTLTGETGSRVAYTTDQSQTRTVGSGVPLPANFGVQDLPEPEIDIQGNGVPVSNGDTTPSSADNTDLGAVAVGNSLNQTYTVRNTGAGMLTLGTGAVTLSGVGCTDFSVTAQPVDSVAASGATAFTVQYSPADTGSDNCTVNVANDDSNENPYTFVISGSAANQAPMAANVNISGFLQEKMTLIGDYTFDDPDSDPESGATYQWVRADDATGANAVDISGAGSQSYRLTATDIGKYVMFCVIPSDGNSSGTESCSSLDGPVTALNSYFSQISAGAEYTCAIVADSGEVVCWGNNNDGQATPPAGSITQLTTGSNHACGIQADGTAECWGEDISDGRTNPPSGTFQQVTAGGSHSCGLGNDGSVECWGDDQYGQLTDTPVSTFTQIQAGYWHTCALKADTTIECWGYNGDGRASPSVESGFIQVSAAEAHSCGLKNNGAIECWGSDGSGRSTPPEDVLFTAVDTAHNYSCGLKTDGNAVCWGEPHSGGRIADVPSDDSFAHLTTGDYHVCGIKTDGSVVCWGENGDGQAMLLPAASDVSISGSLQEGEALTGNYDYSDPQGHPESGSTYRWVQADDNTGSGSVNISGATQQSCTLTANEAGKYVMICITPSDGIADGAEACSDYNGPVVAAVVIDPPGPVTLTAPAAGSTVTDATPDFEWSADANAAGYEIMANNQSGSVINHSYTAAAAGCDSGIGTCSLVSPVSLQEGPVHWRVRAVNSVANGVWSSAGQFTVSLMPAQPALISPVDITVNTDTPAYTWTPANAATYELRVNDTTGNAVSAVYTAAEAGCESGECSVTPSSALAEGPVLWRVRAANGVWSNAGQFTVSLIPLTPSQPALISPVDITVNTDTPAYTWTPANAAKYELKVNDITGSVVSAVYTAAEAGCGSEECSVTPSDALAEGMVYWMVRGISSAGIRGESATASFTASPKADSPPENLSPATGEILAAVTAFSWDAASGTQQYRLRINNSGGAFSQYYTPAQAGCSGNTGTCTATPVLGGLAPGYVAWMVEADGLRSSVQTFSYSP